MLDIFVHITDEGATREKLKQWALFDSSISTTSKGNYDLAMMVVKKQKGILSDSGGSLSLNY